MKSSKPGNLTLDVVRPFFRACARSDRKRVRVMGALILNALDEKQKELKKEAVVIRYLMDCYGV